MARRGVWTGSISFGLVSIGVKALTAVHDHDVHFHQLEKGSGSRVGNQKISKDSGKPVESDDIEMGYEVSKGRYVTFDPKEIDEMRPESTRSVNVTDFVDLAAIDPVYYSKTYWLAPTDDGAEQAYKLLAAAMESAQKVGIGTVVMRNKQYLAAIRPLNGALAMSTMRFADEVVDIADMDEIPTGTTKASTKELALANQIIDSLSSDWDPERYHDTFTEELRKLIEAKDRGDEVVSSDEPDEEPEGKVIDLMAALQASVDAAKKNRGGGSSSGSSKRSSSKKAPARKAASKKAPAKKGAATKKSAAKKKTPAKQTPAKKAAAKKAS